MTPPDTRIVYAALCTWWDSIDKAATTDGTPTGLPCCPTCRSPLMEVPDEATWWAGAEEHETGGHPGYVAKLRWMRGQHFASWDAADVAYVEYLASIPLDERDAWTPEAST